MFSIIVATDSAGGFAKNGKIPWLDGNGKNLYPEDFKHFQKKTKNSICVMGRNSYEEIIHLKGDKEFTELLPNRESYVLTRKKDYTVKGATIFNSFREFVDKVKSDKEIFILGGEKLFIEALPYVNKIYMTVIKKDFSCDKKFQLKYLTNHFKIVDGEELDGLYFIEYKRIK